MCLASYEGCLLIYYIAFSYILILYNFVLGEGHPNFFIASTSRLLIFFKDLAEVEAE